MSALKSFVVAAAVLALVGALAGFAYLKGTGLRGQAAPGALETRVARAARGLAIPSEYKTRSNPLANDAGALAPGLEHFAKFCTMCHDNDGSAMKTAIGNGLYPKPPDLRAEPTQKLTDGELFYIIENGVRFTGMPAFGTGRPDPAGDKQVWQLVYFIRHLPRITRDEIEWVQSLNPF
jgi:mono/diheme cytochrome c family protein